ncbi:hypothetical protein F4777DRAFT_579712 [Nemania sp. FL0916]|nr:hypothetical protein F4777DRAFT_579712 [Nemania sp. FL0916]
MAPVVRKDILTLTTEEKDNLVLAFKLVQELPADDPDSFFTIGGLHGIPGEFYCHHGDPLFPTWHRAYLYTLEKSLQKQVPGVALPYWQEIDSITEGHPHTAIPSILTDETYTFADGTTIPNPLKSFTLEKAVEDTYKEKGKQGFPYSKPAGYTTNETADQLLKQLGAGLKYKLQRCLFADSYTAFSNTTSANLWNKARGDKNFIMSLESPHNGMHLALGGIQLPWQDASAIPFANGDMGDNETAGFDPIFYFHHCFIDYMFWNWQQKHDSTDTLFFDKQYLAKEDQDKNLQTSLDPFTAPGESRPMTSQDVVDIANLGYSYDKPIDLGDIVQADTVSETVTPRLLVQDVDKSKYSGSFIVTITVKENGELKEVIDAEPILSRYNVESCANCLDHVKFDYRVALTGWSVEDATRVKAAGHFYTDIHTRDHPEGLPPGGDIGDRKPKLELEI